MAVRSWINIALEYESLDNQQAVQTFREFTAPYEKKNMIEPGVKREIKQWATSQLICAQFDGRQIHNIVTFTMGLAKAAGRKLKMEGFYAICDILQLSKDYLAYQMMQHRGNSIYSFYEAETMVPLPMYLVGQQ